MTAVAVGVALVSLSASLAFADDQRRTPPRAPTREANRPGSFELSVGGEMLTPQTLGTKTATMTSNSQPATPFTYFTVAGTRAASPAFRGRIGYNITRVFTVEGGFVAARGNVNGIVSGDVENAPGLTVAERMTQYFVDVSLLAHLRQAAFANGAGVPFVEGGFGYLRQMHEGNLASDTGQILHFGGGVTYMFSTRPASRLTGMGVRVDARVYVPRKGYSLDGSQQVFAGVGGALLLTF